MRFNYIVVCGTTRNGTTLLQYMVALFERVWTVPLETSGVHVRHDDPDRALLTKAPADIKIANEILRLHPTTAFLITKRDPRDTLCSKLNFDARPDDSSGPEMQEMREYIHYRNAFVAAHPEHSMIIRYEELVDVPDRVQLRIGNFLDVNTTRKFSDYHIYHTRMGTPVQASHRFPMSMVYQSSVGRFREPENRKWMLGLLRDCREELCNMVISEGYERDDKWTSFFTA